MKLLFLGQLFPHKGAEEIRKKARVDMQDAANVLQWNIIFGLKENGIEDIEVISYLPIDSWPKHYKTPFVKKTAEQVDETIRFTAVPFCNVTYVKQILSAKACNRAVASWIKKAKTEEKVIVCYSCNNVLMRALKKAKSMDKTVKIVQTIADITEFASNDTLKGLRKLFLKYQIRTNEKLKRYVDGYVLLTKQMKTKLRLEKPYVVMEGIVPKRERNTTIKQESSPTIFYSGSMNRKYGILQLLEAFQKIDGEEYRLVLCGLGNAEPEIREAVEKDSRICFLGKVKHEEALVLQQQATVLVNPRQNNEEFTKYSFPSKTMEYLASGVPVVAYKLDGIPDEYDEYIAYVEDNLAESLAKKLVEICSMETEDRRKIGEKGKAFVLENKNKKVQTGKILNLIQNL